MTGQSACEAVFSSGVQLGLVKSVNQAATASLLVLARPPLPPWRGSAAYENEVEILPSCGLAATAKDELCSRMPPSLVGSGGGSRHEEGLARRRRVGGANRKPRARSRLARDRTNLRGCARGCAPARHLQLVDRLLRGRQYRRRLGTTWLHPRQLPGD